MQSFFIECRQWFDSLSQIQALAVCHTIALPEILIIYMKQQEEIRRSRHFVRLGVGWHHLHSFPYPLSISFIFTQNDACCINWTSIRCCNAGNEPIGQDLLTALIQSALPFNITASFNNTMRRPRCSKFPSLLSSQQKIISHYAIYSGEAQFTYKT